MLSLYHMSSSHQDWGEIRQKKAVFDTIPVNVPDLYEDQNYEEVLQHHHDHQHHQYIQQQQNRKARALKLRTHFQQMEIKDYMRNFLKRRIQIAAKKAKEIKESHDINGTKVTYLF